MVLIFEQSQSNRLNRAQLKGHQSAQVKDFGLPSQLLRKDDARLPAVSELQAVRHYTRLSQKNFSIDTHFYPLGSCTMKYNPRVCNTLAQLPGFSSRHPLAPESVSQGFLACLFELQEMLKDVTGMSEVSLQPMAGAQGEFAGVAMIRAFHESKGDTARDTILVPDAAHGTNPASAVMCGYKVKEIPTGEDGDIDLQQLQNLLGPHVAGIMLTNPSTLGVFERKIVQVAKSVHECGGLLYYDGANLNAILGKVRPFDMGFDVVHINLHKTFSTPHGGGGPGAGPVGVNERLKPFLPVPIVGKNEQGYYWRGEKDFPQSIGRMAAFMGNAGILLRAYIYARVLGREGMKRVSDFSTLNANYLLVRLMEGKFDAAFSQRRATHEFIISLKRQAKELGCNAMDFAKRLLDYGYHAPTTYFPLLIPECLLVEPTETESKEEIDGFVDAMISILDEAQNNPEQVKTAPHSLPVRRLDDVKAARDLDLKFQGEFGQSIE